MAFLNRGTHVRNTTALEWLRQVFTAKRKRPGQRGTRSLRFDPLEDRRLLSISPVNLSAILVNQTFGAQQVTSSAHSIGVDNNGDFVVAWTRYDNVVNSAGVPVIDPSTGNQMTVANVYARYLTDEVQQVSLPGAGSINANGTVLPNGIASNFDNDPNTVGYFSLTYNAQTQLEISVTAGTAPSGDASATTSANIAGQFTLWFDRNADGKITPNEVTTISFDETNPTLSAKAIQTWLNTFGPTSVSGKLVSDGSHAVVNAIDPQHYLVDFGTATQGLDQSNLLQYLSPTDSRVPSTVPTPVFNLSGFLPAVAISVQDRPFTVNNIPVSQTDPYQTAEAIDNYFQTRVASYTSGAAPFEFPIPAQATSNPALATWAPYTAPIVGPTNSSGGAASNTPKTGFDPSISVTPVVNPDGSLSYTDFTVTFTGVSGKQIEAPLLVTNCVDENGVAIGSATTTPVVTTDATSGATVTVNVVTGWTYTAVSVLKESSPEFKVNPSQSASNIFAPTASVLAADEPSVAMDASGDFVIAWRGQVSSTSASKDLTNIYFRHFSPTGIVSSYNPGTFVPGQTLDGEGQVTDDSGNPVYQVRALANPLAVDVQQITFNATSGATLPVTGNFALSMAGLTTASIYFNGADPNATATNIEAALSAIGKPATVVPVLPSIQPGKPGVYVFKVTFGGASTGVDEPPLTYVPVVDSSGNTLPVTFAQVNKTADMYTVQANVNYTNPQYQPAVAMDTQGNFNIVWANQGPSLSYFNDISMQRFDYNGNRLGAEIQVNTETTSTELYPDVAMGADDNSVVIWSSTDTPNAQITTGTYAVYARGFDANGVPLWAQVNVGGGGSTSVAMDGQDNFLVCWDSLNDTDVNGQTSEGVYAIEDSLKDANGNLLAAPGSLRTEFRMNSASTTPTSTTFWPYDQFNAQAAMDINGDLAASYEGYGAAVSTNLDIPATFFRPYFKLNTDTTATGSQNQDLLPYFNPFPHNGTTGDTLPSTTSGASILYQGDNYNVDTAIDQVLFDAKYAPPTGVTPATDEQLGRLRTILENVAGLLRGDSHAVMTTVYNASPAYVQGPNSSDDIVNTQRTGTDQRYYIVFDPTDESGTFQLRLTVNASTVNNQDVYQDVTPFQVTTAAITVPGTGQFGPINDTTTMANISTAINAALGQVWPGYNETDYSVNIRELTGPSVGTTEYDARTGTYWDFSTSMPTDTEVDDATTNATTGAIANPIHPYVIYELTFQGAAHDIPITMSVSGATMQHWTIQAGQQGAQTYVQVAAPAPVAVEGDYTGVQSAPSYNASVGMTSEGDLVYAYTHQFLQTDGTTPLNADGNAIQQNIYVEQVNESTNSAGPQIVGWTDGTTDNKQFLNGGTVAVNSVQYFVLTFDQPMLAGDPNVEPDSVLNTANYELIDSGGNVISNAITHVDYGLSEVAQMASSYGLNPIPSNKYEVIITLDGNPNVAGVHPLSTGTYTLQVNQGIPSSLTTVGQSGLRNIYGSALYRTGYNPQGLTFSRTITFGTASAPGAPGLAATDLPVNAQRGGQQIDPQVATALDGSYVVVWTNVSNGQTNIQGQRYNSNNIALGAEFAINTTVSTTWGHPSIAMDSAGDFVVAWSGGGSNYNAVSNPSDIYARRFNAKGQAIGGQFLVNQYLSSAQTNPRVAMAPDGMFIITWQSYGQGSVPSATTVNYAIYAREYSVNGTPVSNATFQTNGNEFQVSAPSPYARTNPDVAMDAADNFVIVWSGDFQQQSTWGVYGDYYNASTGKSTGDILLNKTPNQRGSFNISTTFDLVNTGPRVSMATASGNFVVTWTNYNSSTSTGYNIYARQFAPGCVPLAGTASAAGEFQVNQNPVLLQPSLSPPTIGWQLMPDVGVAANGDFTVAWTSYGQDNAETNNPAIRDYGIYARMYFANGTDYYDTNLGTYPMEYRVNATTLGNQVAPAVNRGDAAGDSMITWVGPDPTNTGATAIFLRVVDPPKAAQAAVNAAIAPAPTITVSDATVSVGNATTQATFTVALTGPASKKQVSFNYTTADGSAKAGKNYTAATGTLSFAPGQTSKTITVSVAGISAAGQPSLNYALNVKNAINGKLTKYSANGTIVDGVQPPAATATTISVADVSTSVGTSGGQAVFTVTLSAASSKAVTVTYSTADGSAKAGKNYTAVAGTLTFSPGQTSKTVAVPLKSITAAGQANTSFQLKLASPVGATIARAAATGTIVDGVVAPVTPAISVGDVTVNVGSTSTTVTFTVSLSAATTKAVTVKYATADGSAKAASKAYTPASGTLTFAAGQTTKTVTVVVAGFKSSGVANQTFLLNLSNAVNSTISRATATATLVDTVKAPPSLTIGNVSITRPSSGTAYATFVVTLSYASTQAVTINYTTANGTALAGKDYSTQSGKITFAAGVTSMKINIPILGSSSRKGSYAFNVLLSSPLNAVLAGSLGVCTISSPTTTVAAASSGGTSSPTASSNHVQASSLTGMSVIHI